MLKPGHHLGDLRHHLRLQRLDHYAPVRTTTTDVATARATRLLTSATPTRIKHTAWATLTGTHPPNR